MGVTFCRLIQIHFIFVFVTLRVSLCFMCHCDHCCSSFASRLRPLSSRIDFDSIYDQHLSGLFLVRTDVLLAKGNFMHIRRQRFVSPFFGSEPENRYCKLWWFDSTSVCGYIFILVTILDKRGDGHVEWAMVFGKMIQQNITQRPVGHKSALTAQLLTNPITPQLSWCVDSGPSCCRQRSG